MFEDKRVCELGAGKSGLAAIALAIKLKDKIGEIMISDGNEQCCESIRNAVKLNQDAIGIDNLPRITVKWIVWDEGLQLSENKYHYICIADWLFFRKYHRALEHTISELLEDSDEEGRVFIMGPNRSNTMWEFIDKVEQDNIFEHSVEEIEEDRAVVEDFKPLQINTAKSVDPKPSKAAEDSDSESPLEDNVNLPVIDDGSDKCIPGLDSDPEESGSPSPKNSDSKQE